MNRTPQASMFQFQFSAWKDQRMLHLVSQPNAKYFSLATVRFSRLFKCFIDAVCESRLLIQIHTDILIIFTVDVVSKLADCFQIP